MRQFKLLGTFELRENGQLAGLMTSPKGQAVTAYLIINDARQPREVIADLLWESASTKQALRNLRSLLSRIRRSLPPEVNVMRKALAFESTTDTQVDWFLLQAGLTADSLSPLDEALKQYTGELLEGFYLPDAPYFNEWLTLARERVRQQVKNGYRRLCSGYKAAQQWGAGIAAAARWIAVDDLNEEAYRVSMALLVADGQITAALQQYENCRRLLWDELGVDPEATTQQLAAEIKQMTQPQPLLATQPQRRMRRHDWGEAPRSSHFFGRETELDTLRQWLLDEDCRVVSILGIGGQGKTSLAIHAARALADQFDGVFWRSLLNAPPLERVLRDALHFLQPDGIVDMENDSNHLLWALQDGLKSGRYLLVLDNVETILQSERTGRYRSGYEPYRQLIELLGQANHDSCLLLTSREQPQGLPRLEKATTLVRMLRLQGVATATGRAILNLDTAEEALLERLIGRYSGNPLALKLVAETIADYFDGDLAYFLNEETPIFADIRDVLDQQFLRLQPLEQEILLWLAITRQATPIHELSQLILRPLRRSKLLEAVGSLQQRSLLEKGRRGIMLQNVVTEYLIDHIVERVSEEILFGEMVFLGSYALQLAQTKEYIRQSQARLFLEPIGERILEQLAMPETLDQHLHQLLNSIRTDPAAASGYAAGNLLNLLLHIKHDIAGYDFSALHIRQAHFQGAALSSLNFTNAIFHNAAFTDTFGLIYTVAYSPDGHLLVAGSATGEIRLWRTDNQKLVGILKGHEDVVWTVAFSPDGQMLASGSGDQTICLWDLAVFEAFGAKTGSLPHQPQQRLFGHTNSIRSLCFRADGKCLASGSGDGTIRLWDVASGKTEQILNADTNWILAVAFGKDEDSLVSAGDFQQIQVWDLNSGELKLSLEGHTNAILAIDLSPDGQLVASASSDQTVRLWNLQTGTCVSVLRGHSETVRAVQFSPNGESIASSSEDKTIRVWDIALQKTVRTLYGHSQWVNAIAFSPSGYWLVSGGSDQVINFWDVRSGEMQSSIRGHTGWVHSIAFDHNGHTLASGTADHLARLWDVASANIRQVFSGHNTRVFAVAFSADSRKLVTAGDQNVYLWDVKTGRLQHRFRGDTKRLLSIAMSPDGATVATGGKEQGVYLWQTATHQVRQHLVGHTDAVRCLAFSPNGTIVATGGADRTIRLWDVGSGQQVALLQGHTGWVDGLAFHPNGSFLASGSQDQAIRIWEVATGELVHVVERSDRWPRCLAFSPDGQFLVSGGLDQTVRLWEFHTMKLRQQLIGHQGWIESIAFTPDGRTLATASGDETIRFWQVETGECTAVWSIPGPYEGMILTGATGLTAAQRLTLQTLGAIIH